MITEYVTSSGFRLGIGRIDRREIDRFAGERPIPEPPVKTAAELGIPVFGGVEDEELLPIWDDPKFLADVMKYRIRMFDEELDLVASAITLLDDLDPIAAKPLEDAGLLRPGNVADALRYIVLKNDTEIAKLVEAVLYNSTITPRGLREAEEKLDVQWDNIRLNVAGGGEKRSRASAVFNGRKAAQAANMSWNEFCELTGPEQSEEMAFFILNSRLECLMVQSKRK